MKSSGFLAGLAAVCIAATASVASAQNAIQLFSPADVRLSTANTTPDAPNTFNSKMLSLSCPAAIQATLSSSPDGTGNVLVDNYISLTVGEVGPTNICNGDCFTSSYQIPASGGRLTGQDPDGFVSNGGVAPINISSYLSPGANQVQLSFVDEGGYLSSSTLYLVTSCTSAGLIGSAQITGNPILSSPTSQQLTQSFSYNSFTDQQIQFIYDLSQAHAANTLSIPNGSTPSTGDSPIAQSAFSNYLNGTSFAPANCLVHNGQLENGSEACSLYTLTCQIGTNPNQSGAMCPSSQQPNEIFVENFDGPSFTLPDLPGTDGLTFHQGVGFLEATDKWTGGSCVFDPASSIAGLLCPQNLLTSFSGEGPYRSSGPGQSPNSSFITVVGVPEPLTTVNVTGLKAGNWINSPSPTVSFTTTPPAIPSNNNFVAAPIESLTYGITSAPNVPPPPPPIAGDTTLTNSPCPAPGPNQPAATVYNSGALSLPTQADGQYLLHYYAQDCAGTKELKFIETAGTWSTSFYTFPINIDTHPPVVVSGPKLSPAPSTNGGVPNSYVIGQTVTATYRCTDALSGIVQCGPTTFTTPTKDTGNITSPVDTSKAGQQTFTVIAVDAAGNQSAPASVNYQVVAPPVNLSIVKVAPLTVKSGAQMTYAIAVANISKQTAQTVMITDPLPAGVTFVKAQAQQLVCSNGKCSNPASCTFASNTVTCSTPSVSLLTPVAVEIVVSVQATSGTKIKNVASVSSANPEGSGNLQSSATTTVK